MVLGFKWIALRQADYDTPCLCTQSEEGYSHPTSDCSRCLGTGYLFTDFLTRAYIWGGFFAGTEFPSEVGRISTQGRNAVLEHDRPVNKFDQILELDLDPEDGKIRQPIRVIRAFTIVDAEAKIGKNSRVEFWKCILEERTLDDDKPGQKGTGFTYKGH